MTPATIKHGITAYAKGRCKCRVCRAAWAAYVAGRRERLGLKSRTGYGPQAHSRPTTEQLRALYVDERRGSEVIARYFGVAPQTARNWLHEAGIPVRPAGRPKKKETA